MVVDAAVPHVKTELAKCLYFSMKSVSTSKSPSLRVFRLIVWALRCHFRDRMMLHVLDNHQQQGLTEGALQPQQRVSQTKLCSSGRLG